MAIISFPTSNTRTELGTPKRARPCRCARQCVHEEWCVWCGRLPEATIRATWQAQARRLARVGNRPPVRVRDPREPGVRRARELAGVAL